MNRFADEPNGGQFERTSLSWQRTAVALAANGALVIREGVLRDATAPLVGGVLFVALGVALWLAADARYRTSVHSDGRPALLESTNVGGVGLGLVVMLSLVNLSLVVFT